MNEVQLIRNQLALERAHVSAVANACATVLAGGGPGVADDSLGEFRRASVDCLACVLAWFEVRDQRLADLIELRPGGPDDARRAFEAALARRGSSRDALTQLEAACAKSAAPGGASDRGGWRQFGEYFNGVWSTRREALDTLLASNTRAAEWRAFGGIDADSILEERRRYSLVLAHAPPGVTLAASGDR